MERIIEVTIEREEKIVLHFKFEDDLCLDLSSNKTDDVKCFFTNLLKTVYKEKNGVKFELKDDSGDLFHDVAVKYLSNLNTEVNAILQEIPQDFLIEHE